MHVALYVIPRCMVSLIFSFSEKVCTTLYTLSCAPDYFTFMGFFRRVLLEGWDLYFASVPTQSFPQQLSCMCLREGEI